jgi:hypothetical protein
MIKQEKSGGGLHITIRVKPEVGRNGPFLCGIESLYNGLSETTKVWFGFYGQPNPIFFNNKFSFRNSNFFGRQYGIKKKIKFSNSLKNFSFHRPPVENCGIQQTQPIRVKTKTSLHIYLA